MNSRPLKSILVLLAIAAVVTVAGTVLLGAGPATTVPRPVTPAPIQVPTDNSFSFAVLGDNRDGPNIYSKLLAMVQAGDEEFLINTGDLVANGLESQYVEFRAIMAGFSKPFYPVPGNHDISLNGTLDNYLKFSGAPDLHYSFDRGAAHFTMANSASGGLNASELAWIDADLTATTRAVRFIVLHHPPFDPLGGTHILGKGAPELVALATKHRVRYVLAGHIHEYARELRDGAIYLVAGGAGAPLYSPPDKGGFYHYVRITVSGEETSDEVVRPK